MANDFSGDPNCVALWRFENGALTTDSKGGNTLTAVNTPTADTVDYKEGAASTDLVYSSHQFYKITDANLDAGFPLKSGDSVQKATFCFFYIPDSYASNIAPHTLIGFPGYSPGSQKFFVALAGTDTNNLILYWGYNDGADFYTFDTGIQLLKDNWWHIAIRIDGVNRVLNVRAWKYADSTQKTYSTVPSSTMGTLPTTELRIGGTIQSDTAYSADGRIDEFVVFKDLLTDDEIDAIRTGTYHEGVTTQPPTTEAPTTEAPTTLAPTTLAPTTTAPTTEASTTEAPTTEAPTTEAPTTLAPTTLAPTTEAPTTEAPTTEAPTTLMPSTEGPTTEGPTTEGPTTEGPTTELATTEGPTTGIPTTEGPTTSGPTTEPPTTHIVTTELPTTIGPTTPVVSTGAPTTSVPTTSEPTTLAPTTLAPTTLAPTTEVLCEREFDSYILRLATFNSTIVREVSTHGDICW